MKTSHRHDMYSLDGYLHCHVMTLLHEETEVSAPLELTLAHYQLSMDKNHMHKNKNLASHS